MSYLQIFSVLMMSVAGSASDRCAYENEDQPFTAVTGLTILERPSPHRPEQISFGVNGMYYRIEHGVVFTGQYIIDKNAVCFLYPDGVEECRRFFVDKQGIITGGIPNSCFRREYEIREEP